MSNAGFSAPVNYWGTISGLTPKSSGPGRSLQSAEAANSYGDTVAHDEYGETLAPHTEYAVCGEVDLSDIVLGSIHEYATGSGNAAVTHKLMLTTVRIPTKAGGLPTVEISGVEVEAGATEKRTYALSGTLTPRSRAQDPCGALTPSECYTQIDTTASVDANIETVAGTPVASDCSHGLIEVRVTITDPTGSAVIVTAQAGGFAITALSDDPSPDADYRTMTATATKFLEGEDAEEEE